MQTHKLRIELGSPFISYGELDLEVKNAIIGDLVSRDELKPGQRVVIGYFTKEHSVVDLEYHMEPLSNHPTPERLG